MTRERVDHLLVHVDRLLTMEPVAADGSRRSEDPLGVVQDGAVAVRDGRIVEAAPSGEVLSRFVADPERTVRLAGTTVLPGFIDPHTHLLFAGSREGEFARRLAGESYMEIAAAGGGILSSVRAFRAAHDERILEESRRRCDSMLARGTTTIEVKSGYGLETEQEIRALRLIDRLDETHPCDLIGTFLGAHEVAPEYRDRRAEYVRIIVEEMLPRVVTETTARFCDVFCEKGVFTPAQARTILVAAKGRGLAARLHADEFAPSGAAELAGELHAFSADHLMEATDEGLDAMREAGTIAILLPGTCFSIGRRRYAPARKMLERGLTVALATDCNPGSSMTTSMPLMITLAVLEMKMTLPEALLAATRDAASSLGLAGEVGRIAPGCKADLQVLPTTHEAGIVYELGGLAPLCVMKGGEWVARSGSVVSCTPPQPKRKSLENRQ